MVFRDRINKNGVIVLKIKDLDNDNTIWILDQEKFKRITGKNGTIPASYEAQDVVFEMEKSSGEY